jgi:hypothetical protein
MKAMNIKGKDYIPVNERLKEFRTNELYRGYKLTSDIITINENSVIVKAFIYDNDNQLVATGYAEEMRSDDFKNVNSTSAVENCETSAWGRALGNLGIGIDTSVASADEVHSAISKQESRESQPFTRESFAQPRQVSNSPRQVSQPVQQPISQVDNRPEIGATRIDENGHQWEVFRQKAKDHRFWVNKVTKQTQDIG